MIYGLSAALYGEITIKDGQRRAGQFRQLSKSCAWPIRRRSRSIWRSAGGKKWGGIGEPGTAATAPAVANAVFAATGTRVRSMPLKNAKLAGPGLTAAGKYPTGPSKTVAPFHFHDDLLGLGVLDRLPDTRRRHRHFQMPDSVFDNASITALATDGSPPDVPASPQPLAPSGLLLVGTGWLSDVDHRRVVRARHGVVHERAGHQLAVEIVDGLLKQHLAQALHHAALNLALDQQRIDDGAKIIDCGVSHDVRCAGVRIDLDFGDMAAIREGGGDRFGHDMVTSSDVGTPSGSFRPPRNRAAKLQQIDRAVGAGNDKTTCLEFDVAGGRFQHMRGNLLAAVDDLVGGLHRCAAPLRASPSASRRCRRRNAAIAVAFHQPDAVKRNAELVGKDLRVRRRVAHAEVERAGDDRNRAIGLETDRAELLAWRCRDFEIAADTETAQLCLAFCSRACAS